VTTPQPTDGAGVYQFGDVRLDLDRFELLRGGVPQRVEPQVLEVLAYLVRHRDRLVSKQELMDQVWHDRFVSDSAISSRIKAARRVTGDDGERQNVIARCTGAATGSWRPSHTEFDLRRRRRSPLLAVSGATTS
jgi:DNA-binding response OmpR family regulator